MSLIEVFLYFVFFFRFRFFFFFFFFFFLVGGQAGGGAVVICSHTVDVKILCSDVVRSSGCPFIF